MHRAVEVAAWWRWSKKFWRAELAARAQLYRLKAGAFARVVSVMTHVAADGYGFVIALTANECAICATSSDG
jgi:hypothetical protein